MPLKMWGNSMAKFRAWDLVTKQERGVPASEVSIAGYRTHPYHGVAIVVVGRRGCAGRMHSLTVLRD